MWECDCSLATDEGKLRSEKRGGTRPAICAMRSKLGWRPNPKGRVTVLTHWSAAVRAPWGAIRLKRESEDSNALSRWGAGFCVYPLADFPPCKDGRSLLEDDRIQVYAHSSLYRVGRYSVRPLLEVQKLACGELSTSPVSYGVVWAVVDDAKGAVVHRPTRARSWWRMVKIHR